MVTHYFTLRALSGELDGLLRGARIEAIFSQQKNELILDVARAEENSRSSATHRFLCISVNPQLNYMFARDQFARAKRNSVDLFREIIGCTVEHVRLHREDRIVSCLLSDGSTLQSWLYNTASSNVLLVDSNNTISEAFKNNKKLAGTPSAGTVSPSGEEDIMEIEALHLMLAGHAGETTFFALKHLLPKFGSTYSREVLHRARLSEKADAGSLTFDDIEKLCNESRSILEEGGHPQPAIYYRGDEMTVLSVISLQHLSGSTKKQYGGVNEAVRDFVQGSFQTVSRETEKEIIAKRLKTELDRAQRSQRAQREQLADVPRSDEYDRIGKIIMANLQHLTKGTRQVELPDIFGSGEPKRIVLEPQLTPARNAERYFEKAKKARLALEELDKRIQMLDAKVQILEKLLLHLDHCQTPAQVKEFREVYQKELFSMRVGTTKETENRQPFRVFPVAGGFEVWVGKSSANNDLLTMHHSKPNDLWFHVRGAGGSHTVLKVHGSSTMPGKGTILQAAAIAAYYSKMRNSGMVPVAYCERKYVRKPKHAPPGTVILEREKVILVKPALP